jgi:aminopeptidase N
MEALYTQHHEGYSAYRLAIRDGQLDEQAQELNDYRRPIVDRHYTDPMQMFDAITHERGAVILDMLRYVVDGSEAAAKPASQDEPLFRALHSYLASHETQPVDTPDLISAIRASTGQELGWFFREWVFMAGHPDYHVEVSYESERKAEKITVLQTQKTDAMTPIFDMPIEVALFGAHGERKQVRIRDNQQRQEFEIPLGFEPLWVDFDPNGFIDKTLQFEQPVDALIAEAENDPTMLSRLWASQQLGAMTDADSGIRAAALAHVLETDEFYAVRAEAATSLGSVGTDQAKAALVASLREPDSRVRSAVIAALGHFHGDAVYEAFVQALNADSSYAVEAAAAAQLGKSGNPHAFEVLQAKAETNPEVHVMTAVLNALADTKNPRAAEILFAYARPGVPERVRMNALVAIGSLKGSIGQDQLPQLEQVVGAALHDPFFLIQAAGEELVGSFGMAQFKPDIEKAVQSSPSIIERDPAQQVLDQLNHLSH